MENIIIIVMLICIIGGSILYIYKEKKRGKTCIGCPYSKYCSSKKYSGCHNIEQNKTL